MNSTEINVLIEIGATDRVRKKLKRLAIPDRMKLLYKCIPYINSTPKNLKFFKENFSKEIGALILVNNDINKATDLYRQAK